MPPGPPHKSPMEGTKYTDTQPGSKRKTRPSVKAQAAAEASDDDETPKKKQKNKVNKSRGKKKQKHAVLEPGEEESAEEDDSTPTIKYVSPNKRLTLVTILTERKSWAKYPDLTWKMINTILENEEMQNSLYPPATRAGESTRKNGGKPKTDYIWELLVLLFEDHEEYGAAFSQAVTGALRTSWIEKIKNRLKA